jgi:hypothetical protein
LRVAQQIGLRNAHQGAACAFGYGRIT